MTVRTSGVAKQSMRTANHIILDCERLDCERQGEGLCFGCQQPRYESDATVFKSFWILLMLRELAYPTNGKGGGAQYTFLYVLGPLSSTHPLKKINFLPCLRDINEYF